MFSKIDKKILTILIFVVVIILVVGFLGYKYMFSLTGVENSTDNSKIENLEQNSVQEFTAPAVETPTTQNPSELQGEYVEQSLSVCVDKCGDNICQTTDPNCNLDTRLNCLCLENKQECPQDCK